MAMVDLDYLILDGTAQKVKILLIFIEKFVARVYNNFLKNIWLWYFGVQVILERLPGWVSDFL